MHTCWRNILSLLLSLSMLLTLIPTGFALEQAEDPSNGQSATATEELADSDSSGLLSDEQELDTSMPSDDTMSSDDTPTSDGDTPFDDTLTSDSASPSDGTLTPDSALDGAVSDAAAGVNVISDLPQEEPPASSTGSYSTLALDGTEDYAASLEALDAINDSLRDSGLSILSMDRQTQSCAMTRAAELAVLYSNTIRPTGEAWSTVLGDAGSKATIYQEAIAYSEDSPEKIADSWISDDTLYQYLSDEAIRSVGIGCFYQKDGSTYWVLIITNQYTNPSTETGSAFATVEVSYQADRLGTPKLTLSASNLTVGTTGQVSSFVISNGKGYFTPAQAQISYTSNSDAITVDDNGLLTAKAPGQAVITTSLKGTNCSACATVTAELNLTTVKLKAIANQSGGVYLTWEPVVGATVYQVWRKVPNGSWTKVGTPVTQTNYTDTAVTSGSTYIYTVRAQYISDKLSTQGDYDRTGLTIQYLSAPKLGAASASSYGITVQWDSVSGADSYDVYRKTEKSNWVRVANLTETSYVDTDVTAKTAYLYTVRARSNNTQSYYNTAGVSATATATVTTEVYVTGVLTSYYTTTSTSNKAAGQIQAGTKVQIISDWSKQSGGSTWYMASINGACYYIQSSNLLATPQITSVVNAPDGLKVTWNKISNATGYCLYWKDDSGKWVRIKTVTSNSTVSQIVPDSSLTSGKQYTFTVLATCEKVYGSFSATGASAVYVETPALLCAESNNQDQITVTWKQVAGATGYTVYRKTTSSSAWSPIAQISSGSTCSYQDKSVTSMTPYVYTVRAKIGNTLSSYISSGIYGIVAPADKLTSYVVLKDTKYYTDTSTNSTSLGTVKAGNVIQIVSGWSKTVGGVVWYQITQNNTLCYIQASNLLATPKLGTISETSNALKITWGAVSNATGYLVYRKTAGTNWVRIANLSASSLSYTDSSVSSGTLYAYTVKAQYNSIGSDFERSGLTLRFVSSPQLTGISASSTGITVSWGRVTGATGYNVYRKLAGGSWVRIAQVTSGSTLSYRDNQDLLQGKTYYYTVRALSNTTLSYYDTTGISATSTVTLNPVTKSYVTTGMLNYRETASSNSKCIGTFSSGATVSVIPSGTVYIGTDAWYMVYVNGKCYYAAAKYLKEK